MEASERHNTLVHFRFNPEHKAERGEHGMGSNCTGQDGKDVVLKVPVGTVVYDDVTGDRVHEFTTPDERIIIAKGGRGGRGNQHFATPTHQAPRHHEPGREGEQRALRLELKLLADVGLVGYPNVGKSTLISVISAARPKIANYEFTTLEPNLGVATIGEPPNEESFVVADVPGLIEGAHLGHGLGTQFLRHIERTRMLVHLVDVSDASGRPDPIKDFGVIMNELESFGAGLVDKPMLLVAAKIDVANPKKLEQLRKFAERKHIPFAEISAVTGAGVQKLKYTIGKMVREIREGKYIVLETKREAPSRKPRKPKRIAKPAKKKSARKTVAKRKATTSAKTRRRRAS
jgi:GTP-binding protein